MIVYVNFSMVSNVTSIEWFSITLTEVSPTRRTLLTLPQSSVSFTHSNQLTVLHFSVSIFESYILVIRVWSDSMWSVRKMADSHMLFLTLQALLNKLRCILPQNACRLSSSSKSLQNIFNVEETAKLWSTLTRLSHPGRNCFESPYHLVWLYYRSRSKSC